MTERALPRVSAGTRRPVPLGDVAGDSSADTRSRGSGHRSAATRPSSTSPARAGLLLGASAAVYAVSLAGVSALQADTDAQAIAARAPYLEEIARLETANDELERALVKADAEARALAADYGAVGVTVTDYQARLDALAGLVAEVEGSVAALPARIKLPNVTMRGPIAGTSRSSSGRSAPSTNAKSGASGG